MSALRFGYVAGPLIGALWTLVMAVIACIVISSVTGERLRPVPLSTLVFGAWLGFVWLPDGGRERSARILWSTGLAAIPALAFLALDPAIVSAEGAGTSTIVATWGFFVVATVWPLERMLRPLPFSRAAPHEFESAVIRFMMGFGCILLAAVVAIPLYV